MARFDGAVRETRVVFYKTISVSISNLHFCKVKQKSMRRCKRGRMLTLNNIPYDPFGPYPTDNPPLYDDYVSIVIGETDERAIAPDAIGDLWDLRQFFSYDLAINDVILEAL